jgi:hypothetical protein
VSRRSRPPQLLRAAHRPQAAGDGFNYFVAEQAQGLSPEQARANGYGVFSARYGNIYTVRQLLQLFERAHGHFAPVEDH